MRGYLSKFKLSLDAQLAFFAASYLLVIAGFIFLIRTDFMLGVDTSLVKLIGLYRTASLNYFFSLLTDLGSQKFVALATILLGLLYIQRKKWYHIGVLFVAMLGQEIIGVMLKHGVGRARPDMVTHLIESDGFSFPSGHALVAASFYGALIYFVFLSSLKPAGKAILGLGLFLLIMTIGFSRLYPHSLHPKEMVRPNFSYQLDRKPWLFPP